MASSRKKTELPAPEITAPKERGAHDEIEIIAAPVGGTTAGGSIVVSCTRITTQTTLDRLHVRRLLAKSERDAATLKAAGEQLQRDWHVGGFQPAVTVNLFRIGGGQRDLTDVQLDARRRFNRAMKMLGPLADIAYDFLCLDYGLRKLECDHGWRHGSALFMVRRMLVDLAKGYGFLPMNFLLETRGQ